MLVLVLPRSMGKQATCVFITVCMTASRLESCYSSERLFFLVVCGNNGTKRPRLHTGRGLLFLATACAAQDITQSFGCLWSVEPWVYLKGSFQSLLLGIKYILKVIESLNTTWFVMSNISRPWLKIKNVSYWLAVEMSFYSVLNTTIFIAVNTFLCIMYTCSNQVLSDLVFFSHLCFFQHTFYFSSVLTFRKQLFAGCW